MSDTVSSIILYVSTVIFTAVLIAVMFNFKDTLVVAGVSANNDNEQYITGEELERLSQFTGKEYTGSQLIDVIAECFDRRITVTVETKIGTRKYPYKGTADYVPLTDDGKAQDVSKIINIAQAKKDLNMSSLYRGSLVEDAETGGVTGIIFKKT